MLHLWRCSSHAHPLLRVSLPISTSLSLADSRILSLQQTSRRPCSHNSRPVAKTSTISSRAIHNSPKSSDNKPTPIKPQQSQPANMTGSHEDAFAQALHGNAEWRKGVDPALFEKLSKGQSPKILWIGCSDSRAPETTLLGLKPGDVFTHRNIANILTPNDLSSLSVIEYAVHHVHVEHLVVCGHTSCGGIAAGLGNSKIGVIDNWLMPLRNIRAANAKILAPLSEEERRAKMTELNVKNSVKTVLENPVVMEAIAAGHLTVHGCVYNIGTGELKELDIKEDDETLKARKEAFETK